MIQRIQSVYLVAGAICLALTPWLGQLQSGPAASLEWFVPAVAGSLAVAFLVAIVTIFLYKNRTRQLQLVLVAQIVVLIALVTMFVGRRQVDALPGAEAAGLDAWFLFLLPVVAYIAFRFARRGIDKDMKLVQSMDRLR